MKNKNIKKNFLDFGIQKSGKRKIYETLNGDLYDTYMLGRYFKDIFNLDRVIKRKIKFHKNILHDIKDLRFNLINFLIILNTKNNKFYEFGFTLYEKIFYFKFLNSILPVKLDLKKINFCGNDISEKFIFFSENFYKNNKIYLSKNIKKNYYFGAIFFSKGVTLLYEKKNMIYLTDFVNNCSSGSFDISLYPQKKSMLLETGYQLYYPSVEEFKNLLKLSNKYFFYRNKKKIGSRIYLEIIFGDKYLDKKINTALDNLSKNNKIKNYSKYFSLKKKFHLLSFDDFK